MKRMIIDTQIKFSVILLFVFNCEIIAATYYVAAYGSDSNDGSINYPWATVKYGISKLANSDILFIREGIYYESSFSITNLSNILISAFPNENVEITGGIPDFRQATNNKWELVDAGINLYRSVVIYPSSSYMNAWLLDDDLHLITYDNIENLKSTNYGPVQGFLPIYQGPGILFSSDGHIYIRLENNPNDLIDPLENSIEPIPAEINPNNHSISVFFTKTLLYISNASFVKFKDLTISHAQYLMDITSNTSNFEFDSCSLNYGRYAMVFRSDAAVDYKIYNCEFNNGTPDYIYWCDVKNRDQEVSEPYPEFQSSAITGSVSGFIIRNNIFRDSFDAIFLKAGTENTSIINNEFIRLKDDAITFGIVSNVDVVRNIMWYVRAGVSCDFDNNDTSTDGCLYIHHNIIDISHYQHGGRKGNYRSNHWPVWSVGDAFGSHGDTYPAGWKVYNNTTVTRRSGYNYSAAEVEVKVEESSRLYVYNNIFLVLDDRIVFKLRLFSSGAHYDGNVMYRLLDTTYHQPEVNRYPLFYQFGNGISYTTLFDFKTNSGTDWEVNGLEIDPQLDIEEIINGSYDGEVTWKRYFPKNPEILTTGASYYGLDWPCSEGVNYRGAMKDSITASINYNFVKNGNLNNNFVLKQNYPNPFNPSTTIHFSIPKSGKYSITVSNLLGQEVAELFDEEVNPGNYSVNFNADIFSSGIYFYTLGGQNITLTKKMILLK